MEAGTKLIECENMGIGAMADEIVVGSAADGGICFDHTSCKTAGACCSTFSKVSGVTSTNPNKVCFAAGTT
jgi:hypothetical protein